MTTISTTSGIPRDIHDPAIANRLKIFREKYIDKSQNQAAKKLKIAQSSLSYMEIRKLPVRFEFITRLVREYGLNQDWLSTGNGSPIDKNPSKTSLITDMNAISMELGALKDYIKRMEANQNYMLKLIDNLNKKIEKLEGK